MLTYREACDTFTYDRDTGILYWKRRKNPNIPPTLIAGTLRKNDGYINVMTHGKIYASHRIIMLLCYGFYGEGLEVDHINHVRDDNRLCNLRFVTRKNNRRNQSVSSKNTTGYTGTYFNKKRKKYVAQIKENKKVHYLGSFDTLEEAVAARKEADRIFKFNINHGEGEANYVRKKATARLSIEDDRPHKEPY